MPLGPRRSNSARRGAIALWTLGSISLVAGVAFGIGAVALAESLDENCGDDPCHPSFDSDVDAFHGLGHTASVTIPLGAVMIAGGLAVWFASAPSKDEAWTPWIGPGSAGVRGAF